MVPLDAMMVVLGDRRYAVERFWASPPDGVATGLPSQVAVDRAGRVHFLQRAKPAVLVFEPDGDFAFAYGDQLDDPHGIYRDAADRIFVADRDAHPAATSCSDWVSGMDRAGRRPSTIRPMLPSQRMGGFLSPTATGTPRSTASELTARSNCRGAVSAMNPANS